MTKITERFLSDNYWWCILTHCRLSGTPYDHSCHSVQISYAVSKKFAKLPIDQQGKDHGRHRFFRIDKWNHPSAPPSVAELLELEVEDVIETRFREQLMMYSRTDRYWQAVMSHHFPDWDERTFFSNWVRDQIGLDRQVEEVKMEWTSMMEADKEKTDQNPMEEAEGSADAYSRSGTAPETTPSQSASTTEEQAGSTSTPGPSSKTTGSMLPSTSGEDHEHFDVEAAIAKYNANKSPEVEKLNPNMLEEDKQRFAELAENTKGKEKMTDEEFVEAVNEVMKPATFKITIKK